MFSLFIAALAVCHASVSGAIEHHSQKVLSKSKEPSNFIESSIFGHRSIDVFELQEPQVLPPTYRPQDADDSPFQGLGTFAHLDFTECTKSESSGTFDIGIVGHPFDLGVSYRPGARFGPNGARQGARRMSPVAGWE
jgi:agmatinase